MKLGTCHFFEGLQTPTDEELTIHWLFHRAITSHKYLSIVIVPCESEPAFPLYFSGSDTNPTDDETIPCQPKWRGDVANEQTVWHIVFMSRSDLVRISYSFRDRSGFEASPRL